MLPDPCPPLPLAPGSRDGVGENAGSPLPDALGARVRWIGPVCPCADGDIAADTADREDVVNIRSIIICIGK